MQLLMTLYGDIFSCQFCVFKAVLTPGLCSNSTFCCVFQVNLKKYMHGVAWKLKRQMQD